eukprot:366182-Chlamydomonas_euryale.AAC.18
MTGLLTGGRDSPRQKSGFDGDSSHFDPICELAIRAVHMTDRHHLPGGGVGCHVGVGLGEDIHKVVWRCPAEQPAMKDGKKGRMAKRGQGEHTTAAAAAGW